MFAQIILIWNYKNKFSMQKKYLFIMDLYWYGKAENTVFII